MEPLAHHHHKLLLVNCIIFYLVRTQYLQWQIIYFQWLTQRVHLGQHRVILDTTHLAQLAQNYSQVNSTFM